MRPNLALIATAFLFVTFFCLSEAIARTVVINGTPLVQVKSTIEIDERNVLNESQKNEYRLIITKEANTFIWESRENKNLIHSKSGAIDYFIDPAGGGYIKISKQPDGKVLYLEHMSLGFFTVTYWGVADQFEL